MKFRVSVWDVGFWLLCLGCRFQDVKSRVYGVGFVGVLLRV